MCFYEDNYMQLLKSNVTAVFAASDFYALELLFKLCEQLLDILQCPVELLFIRTAATQFECDRPC